jgi:hypothetical protein
MRDTLSRLFRSIAGVLRRSDPEEPESGSTLELSRTDIEIIEER